MNSSTSSKFALAVAELPPGLQEIVARELELGNAIVDTGHSFPAPPIGVYVKMRDPLAPPGGPLPAGVTYALLPPNRQWTREFADEKRTFFVIDSQPPYDAEADRRRASPPTYLQSLPSRSSAARARRETTNPVSSIASKVIEQGTAPFVGNYSCKLDFRGETLSYVEQERSVDMQCFWTRGYMIEANTITEWFYCDGQRVPVTDDERIEIIRRVVLYAKQVQGVVMTVNT